MGFLQNVLRYTTTHTAESTQDGATTTTTTSEKQQREMSPERRKWLENALDSMTINPIEEMKKCMKYLDNKKLQEETSGGDDSVNETIDKQIEALETLKDWCEDINFAIDFHKLNGYDLLPGLLNSSSQEVRALACELIGTCAQNNPYCQQTLIDAKMLPLMLQKLDKDENDVKIKAMFAISCLTRDYEPGQKRLLEGNAFDILVKSMNSPVEKLRIKACFLFSSISNNKEIKEQLTNRNLIRTLVDLYRNPDIHIHEHLLSAISVLIEENPLAIKQAKEMTEINFKQVLAQRIELIKDDPRFNVS